MPQDWRKLLERWQAAGVLDAETAQKIVSFETREDAPSRLQWPVILALILGGIAIGAGVLLMVAANWDRLSPSSRFALVVFLVAIFHLSGTMSAKNSKLFQSALHGLGTVALGAAIALTGQIFQLPVDWPGGMRVWVIGALAAWFLLRDAPQLVLVAVIVPLWLGAEVDRFDPGFWGHEWVHGALLLAIVYLGSARIALVWIGAIALLPLTIFAGVNWHARGDNVPLEIAAFIPPLILGWFLRRREVWIPACFAFWIAILTELSYQHSFLIDLWGAFGSIGLVAWGWYDRRAERVNLGVAGFALSVLFFYVSNVLDKIGRSASLITLGVLLLAGGWALERARRKLVGSL